MSAVSTERPPMDPAVAAYVADSYPNNADYVVAEGALRPRRKLRARLRRILPLYAEPRDELLDLSSSKGYFVLEAAARPGCERALGIDVHERDVEAARAVAAHLGLAKARFELLGLRELAARIDDFGGPFRTVLLLNTYPYLYFGSDRGPAVASDHDELFRLLARVTGERLLFSNRVDFDVLQRHMQARARAAGLEGGYDRRSIRAAAERHFEVEVQRPLRFRWFQRLPLWVLRPRR